MFMLFECIILESINLPNFNNENVVQTSNMFFPDISNLVQVK